MYPLNRLPNAPTKFENATTKGWGGDTSQENTAFDLWPIHWGQGLNSIGDTLSRKRSICPLTLTLELRSHKMLHDSRDAPIKFEVPTSKGWIVNPLVFVIQYPLNRLTYAPTKFENNTTKGWRGDAFTRKYSIWPLTLTLGTWSHEMLTNTLYIIWPVQLQGLKLLHPTVKEEMHLQQNTVLYLLISTLVVKVTWSFTQYPLHHVSYVSEVATFNGLGEDAFTRKYNIWPLTLLSRSNVLLPSTLNIMWSIQLQSLKLQGLTV